MIPLEKISDSVYAVSPEVTRSSIVFIELNDFIVTVDSGMYPKIAKELRNKIETDTDKKVETVVITHYHGDHVFGLSAFKDASILSAEKTRELMLDRMKKDWKPEKLREYMESNPELKEKLQGLEIVLPNKTFQGEHIIEDNDDIVRIVETGGHCEGSSFVYFPKKRILIAGDLFFEGMWPYGGDPTADPYKWLNALERMLSLDFNIVVPGHGKITDKKNLEDYYSFLKNIVKTLEKFAEEGLDFEDIIKMRVESPWPTIGELSEKFRQLTLRRFYEVISSRLEG